MRTYILDTEMVFQVTGKRVTVPQMLLSQVMEGKEGRKTERYEFLPTCKIKVNSRGIRDKYERQALKHLEDDTGEYFYKLKIKEGFLQKSFVNILTHIYGI